jgi:hypothetical protein
MLNTGEKHQSSLWMNLEIVNVSCHGKIAWAISFLCDLPAYPGSMNKCLYFYTAHSTSEIESDITRTDVARCASLNLNAYLNSQLNPHNKSQAFLRKSCACVPELQRLRHLIQKLRFSAFTTGG